LREEVFTQMGGECQADLNFFLQFFFAADGYQQKKSGVGGKISAIGGQILKSSGGGYL